MAAPASVALFTERLYALGAEAVELLDYTKRAPSTTADADKVFLKHCHKLLKQVVRELGARSAPDNRGTTQIAEVTSTQFAARTATEKAAHFVAELATTLTTTAAATVVTAACVGQTETQLTSTINAALLAHAASASVTEIALG